MRRKKYMALAIAGLICVFAAGVSGLKAAAEAAGVASAGSFVADGGSVAFHSSDIGYLSHEISLLQDEIKHSPSDVTSSGKIVLAYDSGRRDKLNSCGSINFDRGKASVSAADLMSLADRIDNLGNEYTTMTYRALNKIGTDFDREGNANHEVQTSEYPAYLSRAQLKTGILQSQSVQHLTAAPVVADNITAGAAAWVDGLCVIGNGADNERAYQRGLEDGRTGNDSDVELQYTYHVHVDGNGDGPIDDGNVTYTKSNPGGCYKGAGHTHNKTGTCPLGSQYTLAVDSYTEYENHHVGFRYSCSYCNKITHTAEYDKWEAAPHVSTIACPNTHYGCGSPTNTWKIGCGKKAGQIESVTMIIRRNNGAGE